MERFLEKAKGLHGGMDKKFDHAFVICAYRKSEYLEDCIRSLVNQTVKSRICLTTSTPSEQLESICGKYGISYYVRNGESNIADDWNFALAMADTPYVTIAHQDDLYDPPYAETVLKRARELEKKDHVPLILFTGYAEHIGEKRYTNRINVRIKRFLLTPLAHASHSDSRWRKRAVLRFGNAICCPAVTYHMPTIRECLDAAGKKELFQREFRSNLDWQAWEWLSTQDGAFGYIKEPLMEHRIHAGSETSAVLRENERGQEDYAMFCRFWPKWIAKILSGAYGESEKGNQI